MGLCRLPSNCDGRYGEPYGGRKDKHHGRVYPIRLGLDGDDGSHDDTGQEATVIELSNSRDDRA